MHCHCKLLTIILIMVKTLIQSDIKSALASHVRLSGSTDGRHFVEVALKILIYKICIVFKNNKKEY